MGRGTRRGPKPLHFIALRSDLQNAITNILDPRRQASITYQLHDCYLSAYAMFYLQDPALLEFQRRFQNTLQRNNLSSVFGVQAIPKDSQLRDLIDTRSYEPLKAVFPHWLERIRRAKRLEEYRYIDGKYLITLDGSDYFSSESIHCDKCLQSRTADASIRYHHQILQATIVRPGNKIVVPLSPEFVANTDGASKQDCETNASKRLIKRLRGTHRQLPAIIVGDSLYSKQPFIQLLTRLRFSFILVAKPKDHKSLFEDISGIRRGQMLNTWQYRDKAGAVHRYEWVNGVPLNGNAKSPAVNFVEYWIIKANGEIGFHNTWVTDIEINKDNVAQIVTGGRARWKIENEGFNTLKNHGYHLKHNFGHGKRNLSEAFFLLNLLAFYTHQIFQMVDGLYQMARARFSSRREFWNATRSAFRFFLFDSWDEVLQRMNSPPQPHAP